MLIREQFSRFFLVGVIAFIIDISLYYFLTHIGLSVSFSKASSFIAGTVFGYIVNSEYTFRAQKNNYKLFLKYLCVYLFSMTGNIAINNFLNIYLSEFTVNLQIIKFISVILATTFSMIFNFLSLKYYVYKK